jgi:hypothetical protein
MSLDELLVEWSYRTKKGYPDLGNPSDILVLKEILERLELPTDVLDELEDDEPKIDDSEEIDDLEPNPEEKEEEEEEEEKKLQQYIDQISCPFNRDSAKVHIKNPNYDFDEKIRLINRICNFESFKPIKDVLKSKGYLEFTKKGEPAELDKFSSELQNIIEDISDKDRAFFLNYLRDKNKQIDFKPQPGKRGNLFNDANKTGISDNIITKLVRHTTQDSGKKGVGMGELALSLLFKNVGAAIEKGDLSLDGKEFEIKGEGATLGARPDTVNVINLDNIAKFVKYENEGESGLYFKKDKTSKGKDVKNLYFKGEKWTMNKFSEILADIYREADDKDAFKVAFKQDLKDIDKVSKNLQAQAVDEYFDKIQWQKGELEIQRGIALINAYRYMLKEGFTRFLAHDFGSTGADTGEYIYAEGTPLEIVSQLLEAGAKFEKISPANLKPRIGFARTYKEEIP